MTHLGGKKRSTFCALVATALFTTLLATTAPRSVAAHAGDDCALFAPADVAENDWFGSSAGIDGDTAVITSWIAEEDGGPLNAGAAYVYDRQPNGDWVEGQKLLPSNPGISYNFGFSADIDGDIIAIGAWHEKVGNAGEAGAVYIFERPTPTGTWVETARLTASDADPQDDFGYNLEVDAATSSVIVGAHKDDEGGLDSGAAYVFRKDVNDVWIQEAKLLDPNAGPNDRQGNDVAISGDWAVVGHHLDDIGINGFQSNAGGALVYKRTGTTWGAPIELDGSDPEPIKNRAGYGVDVDGDLLVMTSYHDFDDRLPQAWIFRESGGVWTEEQHIYPYPSVNSGDHPDANPSNNDGTHFGRHVELNNGVIAIGSSYDASLAFERGATHYWTQDTNGLWAETARIDPEGNAKYFHAGIAVALSDTHAVIGAEKGNLNDDGIHEPFQTSDEEIFNSGLACIGELSNILDGSHSPNPFYGVYASVGDATMAEGDLGNTTQVSVDVTLSQAPTQPVTIDVSTADGTATVADSDYTAATQTASFAVGATTATVTFDVIGDFTEESDESFFVELGNPTTGVLIEDGTGQVTIQDEDALEVSVADATIDEGDSGTTTVQVDVSLPFPSPGTFTADVATSNDTAIEGSDYVAVSETVTFNPGEQTKQVLIDIVGDALIEPNETFKLNVVDTSAGLAVDDGTGVITITNDDTITVSIGDATVTEGAEGATSSASLDVTLSEAAPEPIDVTVSTADGTATLADGDYQASSQVVSFATGESTKSVSVTVVGDDTPEADEVFNALLSSPTGGVTIADGSGDITITNDDAPALSVGDASTLEGALGATTSVSVELTLSSPATGPVSVTVDTADGTATTAGADYTAVSAQTVNFIAGETTQTVTIDVLGDDTVEPNEALTLVASSPSAGLTIADNTGTIDIIDDDSIAVIVGDATVTEGAAATTATVDVTVSLTQPAVGPVDVTIATADDSATSADSDYVSSSQLVSFIAGESSKTVSFTVNGDDTPEANEIFLVQASGPTGGAIIADGTGEVTIVNDDSVTVSIADGSAPEGDSGSASLVLDVTLSQAATAPVSVEFSTSDDTATTADNDYVAVTSQTVSFAAGESAKQIAIVINGDEQFEPNETFNVTLANPSAGLTIADGTAIATITNDEAISVSVSDASLPEGADGATSTATVDVTLSEPADAVMTVLIDTADGTAVAGSDYVAPGQQTLTFQVGEQIKTVDITINGDDVPEADESFSVVASAPTGGLVLGDAVGMVTITDDDDAPELTVSIGDVTVVEGDAPDLAAADVTVSLSSPALVPVTLDVSTADGSATLADSDYQQITDQAVSFAIGEQSKVVTVNVIGDSNSEPLTETLTLVGSNLLGSGVSFADNTGTISITDDEEVLVSVADVDVIESDVGAKNLLITFSLNVPTFQTVVVDYTTQDGTATLADVDYVFKDGEVRFSPGTQTLTRGFQYIGDTNIEDDEFFEVVLSNPINADIAAGFGIATVTILDDDTPFPALTVGDVSIAEGDDPATPIATVDLSLDVPATEDVSFTLTSADDGQDDTATEDVDYVAFSSPVTFLTGQQDTTVDVTIIGDTVGELNETFRLVASDRVGEIDIDSERAKGVGVVTILDDDNGVVATVNNTTVVETTDIVGQVTNTIDVDVDVTLLFPATGPMTLDLATADGTATGSTANPDFVPDAGQTISFAAGETSKTATFQVYADNIGESDETFSVVASNPTGGLLIAGAVGEITITDDDPVTVSVSGIAITERDAGTKNAIVTYSLSNPSAVTVVVDYTSVDGTATLADSDYVARSGDVRIPPLATARTRGFAIIGDTAQEPNEFFTVELSNPVNATIGEGVANIIILDDDFPGNGLTVQDVSVVESDGPTTVDVTLSLAEPALNAFTVDVETLNGTAFSGTDYVAIDPPQTVSFAQGQQTVIVSVSISGDVTPEADETLALVASNATGAGVFFEKNTGTITIENDDLIGLSVSDTSVTEGAAASTVDATVDVSLAQPAIGSVVVDIATLDGSATTGDSDYVASTETVTFAPGEQTKPVVIVVNGDDNFEVDESFSVLATIVSGDVGLADGSGEVTITNDDTSVGQSVVIGGATVTETDTGTTVDALVDITLSEPAAAILTVDVATADGTATVANSDYVAVSQTVTFQIGEQTQQIAITINGDDDAEIDEMLTLVGSNPSAGLTIADGIGEITILNNDAAPPTALTVGDVAVVEGDSGITTATVTLSLSQAPIFPVSVEVSTVDGSATAADNDYTAITDQLVTFAAGVQTATVDIDVTGDTVNELDEAFSLVASNPVGALSVADDTGEITVITDDAIMISVGDVTLTEIDAGYKWAQVPFTLTAAPATAADTVTVQYTSVDGTATVADGDYELRASELRFGAGVTSLTRGFKVFGDTDAEANELFTVEISGAVNALIGDGVGEVTILDDDTAIIGLTVADLSIAEGNAGTSVATVDVSLASPAVNALTVDVASADGTATTADSDYVAVAAQTLTFAPGEQFKTIDITINGDLTIETDEQFTLVASNPSLGLELTKAIGTITIVHDDQPVLSVGDVTVTEGNAGTVTAAVPVNLDRAPTEELTVVVATVDGSATVADADYTAFGDTLTFAVGEQAKIVNVFINGDTDFENTEQFLLVASAPSTGLALGDDTGTITVTNDDSTGSFEVIVGDASIDEGNAGTTATATVDVSLSFTPPSQVTVDVATADGTATVADADYVAVAPQTITFEAGEQFKTIDITINGDDTDEANETLSVVASNPTGGLTVGTAGTGTVSILNDDLPPTLAVFVGDVSVEEGETGTVIASVPVTLNLPSPAAVSVDVSTVDGTATTADNDYVAITTQTVTFPANVQSATVDIVVNSDTNQELDETFTLVASNPSASLGLGDDTGVITIVSDDGVEVSASDVVMTEIDSGSRWAQMTFTLSAAPGPNTFVVDYTTVDGTATVADGDYQTRTGELRFANNNTTLTRGFRVFGDQEVEADEQFSVVLSNPVNGSIDVGIGVITVLDDDNTGLGLSVGDVEVAEGNAGITTASVPLTLEIPAVSPISVDVASADGTATTADADYSALFQTVTFAAGEQTKNVDVSIIGDTDVENVETLTVVASNPSAGMVLDDDTGVVTITNDDVPAGTAALTVGDVEVTEGETGTVTATVDLTLATAPTDVPVTATIDTVDGTATTADSDYVAVVAQTVTFNVGETLKTVDITVNSDTIAELDETFTVVASNPTIGLEIVDDTGVVTIETDDAVTISASDVTLTEIDSGYRWAQVTFTLSAPPGSNTFIAQYSTLDGTATAADGDYETKSGELRFVNSRTTLTRGIKVFGDTNPELDEVFSVVLSNPVNGIIADGVAEITVLDDDTTDTGLTVGDATTVEGDAGNATALVDITLAAPAVVPVTVDVSTADGTATTGDSDYTAVVAQQVSFAVGEDTKQVSIDITGDTNIEPDEVFTLVASNPSSGLLLTDDTGEITITNDDTPPTIDLSIADVTIAEGNAGQTSQATVTVTLSQNAVIPVSVDLSTVDGSATAADLDFTAVTNQTVTFAAGESSQSIDIDIIGDDVYEIDEVFQVSASNASSSLNLVDSTADITITNDEALPTLSVLVADASIVEGDTGVANVSVDVNLSSPAVSTVSVNVGTADGTATVADSDYDATSETVTFAAGESSKQVLIPVFGDSVLEGDETFSLVANSPSAGLEILDGTGVVTITDDEILTVDVGDQIVVEGDDPSTATALVAVTLSEPAVEAVTVLIDTVDGTAVAATGDYVPVVSQLVTFPIGSTSQSVSITINGDDDIEADEVFSVVASAPSAGLSLGDATGTVTIQTDDQPAITISDVTLTEINGGYRWAQVKFSLSEPSTETVLIEFTTVDGTATAGADYTPRTETLGFPPGSTERFRGIQILGDTEEEIDEILTVELVNAPINAIVADGVGQITIIDND